MRESIAQKINRMPLRYFDSKTHGEVLSRVTNDVDTVSQTLNQSLGQIVTSVVMVIGILIMPWRLYNDLGQYIFTWLIGYGALLGAIAGVMLADYYLVRRRKLEVAELYRTEGRYAGVRWQALVSLGIGIAPNLPGFIAHASGKAETLGAVWEGIYTHAWFASLALAGGAYVGLMRLNKVVFDFSRNQDGEDPPR